VAGDFVRPSLEQFAPNRRLLTESQGERDESPHSIEENIRLMGRIDQDQRTGKAQRREERFPDRLPHSFHSGPPAQEPEACRVTNTFPNS
jgi:hypothetical protein